MERSQLLRKDLYIASPSLAHFLKIRPFMNPAFGNQAENQRRGDKIYCDKVESEYDCN